MQTLYFTLERLYILRKNVPLFVGQLIRGLIIDLFWSIFKKDLVLIPGGESKGMAAVTVARVGHCLTITNHPKNLWIGISKT